MKQRLRLSMELTVEQALQQEVIAHKKASLKMPKAFIGLYCNLSVYIQMLIII
jgi:hypothetical protein